MSRRVVAAPALSATLERISFRAFLESSRFCALTLSPIVAAIADAADGARVTSIKDAVCERVFAVPRALMPKERARTVVVIAGGQGGKTTRLGAPKALHAAWTVPVPTKAGDARMGNARSLIIAPDKDLASTDLEACKGFVWASPVLRSALRSALRPDQARRVDWDGDEYGGPARYIPLRRPDGTVVEIYVRAGLKRGTSARSRPLVGLLLDEACFFEGEGAAVTDKDILDAARQRVVPGGQIWLVSTPWEEMTGEAMRHVRERDAQPEPSKRQGEVLVAGGSAEHYITTHDLRPDWDETGTIRRDLAADPANLAREYQGIPLPSGSSRWFDPASVERALVLPAFGAGRIDGVGIGGDFGFEHDHSAQAAVDRIGSDASTAFYDARAMQEQVPAPGAPLRPSAVCKTAGLFTKCHGGTEIMADGHYRVSVEEELQKEGVRLVDAPTGEGGKWDMFCFTRDLLSESRLRLARLTLEAKERLKRNLGRVLKIPRPRGRTEIYVPRRAGQGHADDVSALVTACWAARTGAGVGRASDLSASNASGSRYAADAMVGVGDPERVEASWAPNWT